MPTKIRVVANNGALNDNLILSMVDLCFGERIGLDLAISILFTAIKGFG